MSGDNGEKEGLLKRSGKGVVTSMKNVAGIEAAQENWKWIRSGIAVLNPFRKTESRVETFENAYARLGLDEDTLKKVHANLFLRFALSSVFLIAGVAISFVLVSRGDKLVILPMIGFIAICLSQMFVASFRAYQIKTRSLCPISEWLANKSGWIPSFDLPPPPKKKI